MAERKETIEGWGRYPRIRARLDRPQAVHQLATASQDDPVIARGNGRSYGDSSFNARGAISMLGLNRLIDFDPEQGLLVCESGTLLSDVIDVFLPRGWFPPVTPGTRFVTIGGMIASNVHGKNSVRDGSFGDHVDWLEIIGPDGGPVRCSRTQNVDLFEDTVGGMGLTGIIVRAAFRLRKVSSGWLRQERTAHPNLDSVLEAFERSEDATYRVAWIDVLARGKSLGRSILDIAEHAGGETLPDKLKEKPFKALDRRMLSVPFALPFSPLNALTVRAFNALHYRRGRSSAGEALVDWKTYFYPLDSLLHWNRIYGRAGFAQYQCVIPRKDARAGLVELLEAISESGQGSFLAVLKRLGDTCGTLSFPMDGYTLALDFPWSRKTAALLDRLDEITLRYGGRVYLAKDSRMEAGPFGAMQPASATFRARRTHTGAGTRFASLQSERLKL